MITSDTEYCTLVPSDGSVKSCIRSRLPRHCLFQCCVPKPYWECRSGSGSRSKELPSLSEMILTSYYAKPTFHGKIRHVVLPYLWPGFAPWIRIRIHIEIRAVSGSAFKPMRIHNSVIYNFRNTTTDCDRVTRWPVIKETLFVVFSSRSVTKIYFDHQMTNFNRVKVPGLQQGLRHHTEGHAAPPQKQVPHTYL